MIIDVVTIFKEMFDGILENSIIKRAIEKGVVEIRLHDFRDYTLDKHLKVDDTTYGGGAGMLIGVQSVSDCIKSIDGYEKAHKILTSPCGKPYNQTKAVELSKLDHIIIVCGHYEGIDDRILNYVDEEISLGDYILTGGEIPALAIIDSIVRLIKGAISDESTESESFNNDLLEYYQYTKPVEFDGYSVPSVLVNGDHEEIRKYRLYTSLKRTLENRPDLLAKHQFTSEESKYLECIKLGLSYEESNLKIKQDKKDSRRNKYKKTLEK